MPVSRYNELRETFDRGFDVLVIVRICGDRLNAQTSLHGSGDKFDRSNP